MPVIRDLKLNLDSTEILRRQEIRQARLQPKMKLENELMMKEAYRLFCPALAYEVLDNADSKYKQLISRISNRATAQISTALDSAKKLAVVICTIGPTLENEVARLMNNKDTLKGFLLDGIGSAAIDEIASQGCKLVGGMFPQMQISSPISPGLDDIPLEIQRAIFELVPASEIGVAITSGNMLAPRKSISLILGIGEKMPVWHRAEVCDRCKIRESCRHRISS